MTDNKPLLLLSLVPRLDILRGRLLLSPKNQTCDGFKHFYFLFVSSWGVCLLFCLLFLSLFISRLRCRVSLYLLNTMQILAHKGHPHVHIIHIKQTLILIWQFGSGRCLLFLQCYIYIYFFFFSKSKQSGSADQDVQWNVLLYSGLNNDAHSLRLLLLGSICLGYMGEGLLFNQTYWGRTDFCSLLTILTLRFNHSNYCTQALADISLCSAMHSSSSEVLLRLSCGTTC